MGNEIQNSNFKDSSKNSTLIEIINSGDKVKANIELSALDSLQLIECFGNIASSVIDKHVEAAKELFFMAIQNQMQLELGVMATKKEFIQNFNDKVDKLIEKYDDVDSFVKAVSELRKGLELQLNQTNNPNLVDKIKHFFNRL